MHSVIHLEWQIAFIILVNGIWEVEGGVLIQPQWGLGHTSVSYVILNQHVPFLASHIITHFKVNVLIEPIYCTQCCLEQGNTTFGLNPLLSTHLKYIKNPYSMCNHQGLFYLIVNYLIVVYLTFIYVTTYLINFWSYIELLKICMSFNYSIFIKITMMRVSIIY